MSSFRLCLYLVPILIGLCPYPVSAAEINLPNPAPTTSSEEARSAWMTLFEHRRTTLQTIMNENRIPEQELSEQLKDVSEAIQTSSAEYQKLLAMIQISRELPMELGLIQDQLQRIREHLELMISPLESIRASAASGMEEITHLDVSLEGAGQEVASSGAATEFVAQVQASRRELSQLSLRVNYALAPAKNLLNQIGSEQSKISEQLPQLWKGYYLSSSRRLFDPDGWRQIFNAIMTFADTFSMRMQAQVPHTMRDIAQTSVRALIVLGFLWGMLILGHKNIHKANDAFRPGLHRVIRHSLPLLGMGIALYVAAWAPQGNPYLLLVVAGTIFLSMGQMRLAWDIRVFTTPDMPLKSPLTIIFMPLLIGLILLFFNLPPEPLGALWAVTLIGFIWYETRHVVPPDCYVLEKNLLMAHKVLLWILLGVTLAGWGRLSILLTMGFVIVVICIQQAVGFVKLSNHISEHLPQKGLRGLLVGVALALAVPILLVVFSLSMGLWILAYPGGSYLLEQVAQADIKLGERSLNFIQILLILSMFYIIRSAITVGSFFLKKLPMQGMLDQNLIGPFQTIYTYVLWGLFGLYVLNALGFSLTSLAVVAGGFSVGVGFGMQSIVNNFVSGLMLIFAQNIREGDIVDVGGVMGTVRKVAIRSTTIETFDNSVVFVPNANLLTNNLVNWTRNGRMVRRTLNIKAAYGADIRQVLEILKNIAGNHPQIYKQPAPIVTFADFADSSLNFNMLLWMDISQELSAMTDLRLKINDAFAENGISIPFPQLDVHMADTPETPPPAAPAVEA